MTTSSPQITSRRRAIVVGLSTVAVAVAGLLLPGAGLALALGLAFTILRTHRTARWVLVGLGAALLLADIGLISGFESHGVGPEEIARPGA